ncbi:MAG: hypothetical protein ACHP8B_16575 [Terriglobales bacterium]
MRIVMVSWVPCGAVHDPRHHQYWPNIIITTAHTSTVAGAARTIPRRLRCAAGVLHQ